MLLESKCGGGKLLLPSTNIIYSGNFCDIPDDISAVIVSVVTPNAKVLESKMVCIKPLPFGYTSCGIQWNYTSTNETGTYDDYINIAVYKDRIELKKQVYTGTDFTNIVSQYIKFYYSVIGIR